MKNTPKVFKKRVQQLETEPDDDKYHVEVGKLMFNVLEGLGFGEGLTIFKAEVVKRRMAEKKHDEIQIASG